MSEIMMVRQAKKTPMFLFVGTVLAFGPQAGGVSVPEERILTEGECPAWSPDGKRIAFQRMLAGTYSIGVIEIASGSVRWIEEGVGQAIQPDWTPDGTLVYAHGCDTETAFAAERAKSQSGFSLRAFKDGLKRDLTKGRFRDYTPAVSHDGRHVYFSTTRWNAAHHGNSHMSSVIARIGFSDGSDPELVVDSPNGNDSGVVQPACSPDGRYLVWGNLESFWRSWRICGARADAIRRRCFVTPPKMIAFAPRWHPSGRIICFTGFVEGDPGWCVYVGDVRRGAFLRIAAGENPCFSPDGKTLAFDREGRVRTVPFPLDRLDGVRPVAFDHPEKIGETLWKTDVGFSGMKFHLPGETLSFGKSQTFYLRVRGVWEGSEQTLAVASSDSHRQAISMFVNRKGRPNFATRNSDGDLVGVCHGTPLRKGEPFALTGVRYGDCLAISIDGGLPATSFSRKGFLDLGAAKVMTVGEEKGNGTRIDSIEIGRDWPDDVERPLTRKEVFE